MGFYIPTCQKMRYKGEFSPSFLLCPKTSIYIPLDKRLHKILKDVGDDFRFAEEDIKTAD